MNSSSRMPPDSALQRTGTHKVLGRQRPNPARNLAPRAREPIGRRVVAELGGWVASLPQS